MNKNDKGHHIGADEQRMKDNRKKMRYRSFDHNSFLSLATGMFSCSRYLATVRRGIFYPFSCSSSVSFSSLRGFFLLSPSMRSLSIFFTSRVETSSPLSVLNDSLKKNFSR